MRQQYEADSAVDAGGESGVRQQRDYSLKEGETMRIALPDKVHIPSPPPFHPSCTQNFAGEL